MFVRNLSDIIKNNNIILDDFVLVDTPTKEYLISLGYCVVGYSSGQWCFRKTKELLDILSSRKGGKTER